MTWSIALSELVGLILAALIALVALWPVHGAIVALWRLPMLFRLRPVTTALASLLMGVPAFLASAFIFGAGHLSGHLFMTAILGAAPIALGVRWWAWRSAGPDLRADAAKIRNELARRVGDRVVQPTKAWRSFVFDVERARRRDEYEPPPI
ncbi:hypothetical protein [Sphingomonas sp. T9W2]|uniref:hypothetical protein n=1 Tax=Sphingomonas sp. T9W2 TaxID=3143183 RepID=UPI0031F4E274